MRTFHWNLYLPPVSVVVLFFVSWAPFHFQRLGYVYFREHEYFRTVNQYLFYLSGCFYFLSSTLNPVLYNLMSAKYRQAFNRALLCKPPNSPSRPIDNACPTTGTNLLNRWAKIILMIHCLEIIATIRCGGLKALQLFSLQQLHGSATEGVPRQQEGEQSQHRPKVGNQLLVRDWHKSSLFLSDHWPAYVQAWGPGTEQLVGTFLPSAPSCQSSKAASLQVGIKEEIHFSCF